MFNHVAHMEIPVKNFSTRHCWQGDTIALNCTLSSNGRTRRQSVKICLLTLGVTRGGLLEYCFVDTPCPEHASVASSIRKSLTDLCKQVSIREVLSTPPSKLNVFEIKNLLHQIDEYLRTNASKKGAYIAGQRIRTFLLRCKAPLAGNHSMGDVHYRSQLKNAPQRSRDGISGRFDGSIEDQSLALPVSASVLSNLNAQELHLTRHFAARMKPLTEACIAVLNQHQDLAFAIIALKKSPLPVQLSKKAAHSLQTTGTIHSRSKAIKAPDVRFRIALFQADFHSFKTFSPTGHLHRTDALPVSHSRPSCVPLTGIPALSQLAVGDTKRHLFTVLLSDTYLSRTVVVACYLLLLAETRWNSGTLVSLSRDRIRQTERGFELYGLKKKTDDHQTVETLGQDRAEFIDAAPAIKAIKLLLEHDANVTKHAVRNSTSIFVSLNAKYSRIATFDVFLDARSVDAFCRRQGLPKLVASDIRNQIAKSDYFESGKNPEVVRAKLKHKSVATTAVYIRGSITSVIHEANIKHFMEQLAKSVRFVTGQHVVCTSDMSADAVAARTLLFPPTPFHEEVADSLVDKWLAADGDFSFRIGITEVEHCEYQRQYYAKHTPALLRANEPRFFANHLPRILVCLALHRLIAVSHYSAALARFSETLHA